MSRTRRPMPVLERIAINGFTLVEMLVALFIFGLLATAGVLLLRSSADGQSVLIGRLDEIAVLNRASGALAADLAQAVARPSRTPAGDPVPAFATGAGVLFTLTRGGWSNFDDAPRADLQRVSYRFEQGTLKRISFPALDGAVPRDAAKLMDGLTAATVRFRQDDGSWRDDWTPSNPQALPRAVELTLKPEGGADYILVLAVGPQVRSKPAQPGNAAGEQP